MSTFILSDHNYDGTRTEHFWWISGVTLVLIWIIYLFLRLFTGILTLILQWTA